MLRLFVTLAWLLAGLGLAPQAMAQAAHVTRSHGSALVRDLALPPDFSNFPYVNANAPKGGEVSLSAVGSFDSFNPFIVRGSPAAGALRVFDTLMVSSADEPGSAYCHVASAIEVPDDRSWVAFDLRPEAKFHDGHPITSEDVAWTFNTLREQGRPFYKQYYADVDSVATDGPQRVVFRFKTTKNRELPQILGEMPILPKHWWEGRDFSKPLSEPPLGSGAYRIGNFEMGRTLVLERVPDYWGRDLPTAKGLNNFDRIRTEYFRDASVSLEAFKAGQVDWRVENIAKNWATAYDFPAVDKGLVKKQSFERNLPTGMQGFAMNTRRPIFADRHVRDAMIQVFDFEWMNRNLFYDSYTRTPSYFNNSDFASSGLPKGLELEYLEPFRGKVPDDVFTREFKLPVTDGSGNNREGLRRALELLKEAGWTVRDRKLVNSAGEPFRFEILLDSPSFERVALPYVQSLERLGMQVNVRTVDPAQYQRLMDTFDYDMTVAVFGQSSSPGNEQLEYWSCQSAKAEGSDNTMGVCDPAIDSLVGEVLHAKDYVHLVAATQALDRVLLNNAYLVPQWFSGKVNVAYWNRFGFPSQPVRAGVVFDAWWVDPALAAATDAARRAGP